MTCLILSLILSPFRVLSPFRSAFYPHFVPLFRSAFYPHSVPLFRSAFPFRVLSLFRSAFYPHSVPLFRSVPPFRHSGSAFYPNPLLSLLFTNFLSLIHSICKEYNFLIKDFILAKKKLLLLLLLL